MKLSRRHPQACPGRNPPSGTLFEQTFPKLSAWFLYVDLGKKKTAGLESRG